MCQGKQVRLEPDSPEFRFFLSPTSSVILGKSLGLACKTNLKILAQSIVLKVKDNM